MWTSLTEILFPKICPLCREELCAEGDELCENCLKELPNLPERVCPGCGGPNDGILDMCSECVGVKGGRPWRLAVTAFPFFGVARKAVHDYKYRGCRELAPFFAGRMIAAWRKRAADVPVDAVTYVPLHFLRYWMRGYNQAELLAKKVAGALGVPCVSMLKRSRYTRPQAQLNMEGRLANLIGAYKLRPIHHSVGKHVLLIDDVFTTGTTLALATSLLLKAGVAEVCVMTIARD